MRTEHEANLALQPKQAPSWTKPSTCKRTTSKPSLIQRFLNLFI